jgi:hypothetical protein
MKVTISFEANVDDIDMSTLQEFVDGINHADTVKVYSESFIHNHGEDEECDYDEDDGIDEDEGIDEDDGIEHDEQTDD